MIMHADTTPHDRSTAVAVLTAIITHRATYGHN